MFGLQIRLKILIIFKNRLQSEIRKYNKDTHCIWDGFYMVGNSNNNNNRPFFEKKFNLILKVWYTKMNDPIKYIRF